MAFRYPTVRRDNTVIDVYHNMAVADPYRWLEDPDSEETKEFIIKQNALTNPYIDSCRYKREITEQFTRLWNYPKVSAPYLHGSKYFQFRNTGLQNQNVLYICDHLFDDGSVFLDPNTFSEDGTVAMVHSSFSRDGSILAYGVSASGSDWIDIKFRSVETGEDYLDVLHKVKYSFISWCHDNQSCFYAAYLDQTGKTDGSETDCSTNQKLYYHKIGTPQSEDVVVVEFEDPEIRCQTNISDCGNYLVLTPVKGCKNNLLSFCDLRNLTEITGKLEVVEVVTEFSSDFEFVANNDSKFVFLTNHDAANYHLMEIDFNNFAEDQWTVLLKEHPDKVLDWAKPINNTYLITCYMYNVKDELSLFCMERRKTVQYFPLEPGSISGFSGKREDNRLFFCFTSFLIPNIVYCIDFTYETPHITLWHETILPDFNPAHYETKQVFYTSTDDTKIPMYIIHKKNMIQHGMNPCLLYGYGGFNVSVSPNFSVSRLIFMSKFNGICAIANIRGGGEFGESWHNAGRFEKKQNVFNDFQRAAIYLIEANYTSAFLLTIQGASNGGLLVGACINQYPRIFGCAICLVGVLDMLRYHKFTIGYAWKSDYGCSDDPKQFQYLYKYSPLHNVRKPLLSEMPYPATLLLTGDHDDRVVPLHSYKFIAELQYRMGTWRGQEDPLMIRIDTKSGHGTGKPTAKIIEEQAAMLCFIQKSLDLLYFH